jgi:hypothetical protein
MKRSTPKIAVGVNVIRPACCSANARHGGTKRLRRCAAKARANGNLRLWRIENNQLNAILLNDRKLNLINRRSHQEFLD